MDKPAFESRNYSVYLAEGGRGPAAHYAEVEAKRSPGRVAHRTAGYATPAEAEEDAAGWVASQEEWEEGQAAAPVACRLCGAAAAGVEAAAGWWPGYWDEARDLEDGPACARCAMDRLADDGYGGHLLRADPKPAPPGGQP